MEHIKYCRNINTENAQNKRDTDIRGSPSLGYVHPEQPVLPFYYPAKLRDTTYSKSVVISFVLSHIIPIYFSL